MANKNINIDYLLMEKIGQKYVSIYNTQRGHLKARRPNKNLYFLPAPHMAQFRGQYYVFIDCQLQYL